MIKQKCHCFITQCDGVKSDLQLVYGFYIVVFWGKIFYTNLSASLQCFRAEMHCTSSAGLNKSFFMHRNIGFQILPLRSGVLDYDMLGQFTFLLAVLVIVSHRTSSTNNFEASLNTSCLARHYGITIFLLMEDECKFISSIAGVPSYQASVAFMFLNSFFNGLQGLFLFVIYCVLGSEVRENFLKKMRRTRLYQVYRERNNLQLNVVPSENT